MGRAFAENVTITIPAGGTESDAVGNLQDLEAIGIFLVAGLTPDGTLTVQVSPVDTGDDWYTLQSGGADIAITTGECVVLSEVAYKRLRMKSSAAETPAVAFTVVRQYAVGG